MKRIIKILWSLLVLIFIVGYPIYVAEKTNNYNYLWLWVATIIVGCLVHDLIENEIDTLFKNYEI